MPPPPDALGQLLSMGALIGGTTEYVEILKRRALRRRQAAERQQSGDVGLQGLVRVLLADGDVTGAASPVPERTGGLYRPE